MEYDFQMYSEGPMTTVFLLTPLTDAAKEWVVENVSQEGFQPDYPNRLYVERRFIDMLLDGIDGAGLTVDAIERALVG